MTTNIEKITCQYLKDLLGGQRPPVVLQLSTGARSRDEISQTSSMFLNWFLNKFFFQSISTGKCLILITIHSMGFIATLTTYHMTPEWNSYLKCAYTVLRIFITHFIDRQTIQSDSEI